MQTALAGDRFGCRLGILGLLCKLCRFTFGRGGGWVAPAHDTALGSESIHVVCTDEGRRKAPIWVFKSND